MTFATATSNIFFFINLKMSFLSQLFQTLYYSWSAFHTQFLHDCVVMPSATWPLLAFSQTKWRGRMKSSRVEASLHYILGTNNLYNLLCFFFKKRRPCCFLSPCRSSPNALHLHSSASLNIFQISNHPLRPSSNATSSLTPSLNISFSSDHLSLLAIVMEFII